MQQLADPTVHKAELKAQLVGKSSPPLLHQLPPAVGTQLLCEILKEESKRRKYNHLASLFVFPTVLLAAILIFILDLFWSGWSLFFFLFPALLSGSFFAFLNAIKNRRSSTLSSQIAKEAMRHLTGRLAHLKETKLVGPILELLATNNAVSLELETALTESILPLLPYLTPSDASLLSETAREFLANTVRQRLLSPRLDSHRNTQTDFTVAALMTLATAKDPRLVAVVGPWMLEQERDERVREAALDYLATFRGNREQNRLP